MPALPELVQPSIAAFTERLSSAAGDNLVAVLAYGGVAKGRYNPERSDVNLMIVLREVSLEALDAVATAAKSVAHEARLSLLTLAERELAACSEVFPTKFLDIRRCHLLLHGADVLSALDVPKERLLRQARRELSNLQLRLRQTYVDCFERTELLEERLQRAATPLFLNLGVLIEAQTGARHEAFAEIAEASAALELDPAPLRELGALRRQGAPPRDLRKLYGAILAQLDAALGRAAAP